MTIKDVAKKAGVSISTASYALNGKPNVHPKTRDRILQIAESLNYYPNAHAKNLKSRRSNNIGVFIYGFAGPIFSDLLEGINMQLQKHGYNIIVSSGTTSSVLLRQRSVDAAIIFDSNLKDQEIKNFSENHPIVVLDRYLDGKNIYHSMIQNKELVYDFMKKVLMEKKYKKIAYLSGPEDSFNNIERYEGFKQALSELNINNHVYLQGDFTIEAGYNTALQLIEKNEIPEFIYCANDELAVGVIKAFNEKGIKIPEQCALAGFDGIQLTDFITPKLTTIAINHFEWGRQIAGFITRILSNQNAYPLKNPDASILMRQTI
ncbi:LacI family DNA-binding transcriptional regulator [Acholeplasma hippikon]|uniref:LacI family DNA-binding transcriptional regulator n=1 Tax=Acholeplasma hippikon TaxID=264636 RepID=UPI00138E3DCF|nr:LacI family DNA-binding transcriptional regulator [Acholeplasma hippikon]